MRLPLLFPQLGQSVAEGTVVRWLKREGERVAKDESLVEISTDKIASEIPSPAAGVLAKILVAENGTVKVGTALAELEVEVSAAPPQSEIENLKSQITTAAASSRFLSPAVRAKARELGVSEADLAKIPGTGAGGRVTVEDVEQHAGVGALRFAQGELPSGSRSPVSRGLEAPPTRESGSETPPTRIPMDPVRRAIAAHMVRSAQTAPQVTTVAEADFTAIVAHRERVQAEFERTHGCRLTYLAFVAEAVVKALREFPHVNASVDGETIVLHPWVHLGIAVAADQGLIVPVVKNAQTMDRAALARAAHDLAQRARAKTLRVDDVQGGTFTITNPGVFGNLFGTPLLNLPQVAVLAMGALQKRPVVREGRVEARDMMYLSLTYDHRLIDGMLAGRFLQRAVGLLEGFREG